MPQSLTHRNAFEITVNVPANGIVGHFGIAVHGDSVVVVAAAVHSTQIEITCTYTCTYVCMLVCL